jgi:hypothetical protein
MHVNTYGTTKHPLQQQEHSIENEVALDTIGKEKASTDGKEYTTHEH